MVAGITHQRPTFAPAAHEVESIVEISIDYAKLRHQGGHPIGEYQAIQMKLADMAVGLDAARLLVDRAIETLQRGERGTREASVAKLFASEALNAAADSAVQIHGGMGYMRDAGVERFYRDARVTKIYEGTSEIQRIIIARSLLDDFENDGWLVEFASLSDAALVPSTIAGALGLILGGGASADSITRAIGQRRLRLLASHRRRRPDLVRPGEQARTAAVLYFPVPATAPRRCRHTRNPPGRPT